MLKWCCRASRAAELTGWTPTARDATGFNLPCSVLIQFSLFEQGCIRATVRDDWRADIPFAGDVMTPWHKPIICRRCDKRITDAGESETDETCRCGDDI